ncbi:MAG: hypothetical protein PUB39_06675 [Eubacteriales bacterium]|nr:hypothetical protein [Eubacteriales bacterium]
MAFMDKFQKFAESAGDMAKAAGKAASDKAGDAIEITKLKGKINGQNRAIDEAYIKIGKHYYDAYVKGADVDEDVKGFAADIDAAKKEIEDLNLQIAAVKADDDDAPEAPAEEAKEEDKPADAE